MAERKTIQDRIRESDLSAFSSIGSPQPGTGIYYNPEDRAKLTPAQIAYIASFFAPGAGIADASGNFPEFPGPDVALVDAFSGDPMPSIAENIAAGGIDRYLFAPLQGLGVLGDAAYGIPFAGPLIAGGLKAPAALATLAGGIAKAGKGSKAVDKGLGSLDQPKDMMFIHNTSEEAIKSFDQMGGIPSPSLAVQPADVPLKGFGNIQLIAKPKNFDPAADPRNAVYSADAYTPRAPKKIRLAKEGAPKKFSDDYEELVEKYGFDLDRNLFREGNNALVNLQPQYKKLLSRPEDNADAFDRFFDSDVARLKYLETKVGNLDDWFALPVAERSKKLPNKALYSRDFYKWTTKEKDKYLSQEGVFRYFDDFEGTMVTKPYTLENTTRNMIEETQRGGEDGIGTFGPNRLRALMTKKFKDLPDIKARKDMIKPNEPYSSLVDDVHFTLQDALQDDISVTEMVLRGVADGLQAGKKNIDDIVRIEIQDLDWESPKQLDDAVSEVANTIRLNSMRPVEYFEAKPMRAVTFDEFAGAIVPPKTSQEVIDILENRGLKVIKNDPETDFMKTKARQQFKDQMFSFAPIGVAGGITALSIEDNVDDEDKGIGSITD